MPTAPVAPTTATCGSRFIEAGNYRICGGSVKRASWKGWEGDAHFGRCPCKAAVDAAALGEAGDWRPSRIVLAKLKARAVRSPLLG
jgi:hypothetical protein